VIKEQNQKLKESHPFKHLEKNLSAYDNLSDREKIIFLAGVFDGEGAFGLWSQGKGNPRQIAVTVESTDSDMVARFHHMFGGYFWVLKRRGNENHKNVFRWKITGDKGYEVLEKMIPYCCNRRKEKFYGLVKPTGYGGEDGSSHIQKQTRIKEVNE